MVDFEDISDPHQLWQWVGEHCIDQDTNVAILHRYNEFMMVIDRELGDQVVNSLVSMTDGEIRSEDGQLFKTKIILRSVDKMTCYRVMFVLDAEDLIIDLVYMAPDDPRVHVLADRVH